MRAEIIHREQGTQWVRDLAALRGGAGRRRMEAGGTS
jgi:hypothetical protein